jgi:hypothetical protein
LPQNARTKEIMAQREAEEAERRVKMEEMKMM